MNELKRRLKICFVSIAYPPETDYGGIGVYTYNIAHGMTQLGHESHVISFAPTNEATYKDNGVFVHRIKPKSIWPKRLWTLDRILPLCNLLFSFKAMEKLNSLIKTYHIDIVEIPNYRAEGFFIATMRRQIPVVCRLHTPYSIIQKFEKDGGRLKRALTCWLEKKAVTKSTHLVASTKVHALNVTYIYRIPFQKISIVPLGIELPQFIPHFSKKNGILSVLFVSRLEKRKGIDVLLKAIPEILQQYSNVHFYIVGKDPGNQYEMNFRHKFGNRILSNVTFAGHVTKHELQNYFLQCDIVVIPSLYESFGLVYIEAMAYGKPIIACDIAGVKEIIEDGQTGILFPPNNIKCLVQIIINLLKDEEKRYVLGKKAFEKVRRDFQRLRMAKNTLQVYQKVLLAKSP